MQRWQISPHINLGWEKIDYPIKYIFINIAHLYAECFLCTELDIGGDLDDFVHQVVTRLTVMSWSHWHRLLLPHRFPNRMWAVSVPVWEWPVYSVCVAVRWRHGLLGREWRDVLRWVCVRWCVWELKASHLRITSARQHNIRHCSDAWTCLSWCAPRLQASVMPACDFPDPQLN